MDFSMSDMASPESKSRSTNAVHIPAEVVDNIVSFVKLQKNSQSTLHSCCLVSRSWYSVALAPLYQYPVLKDKNCLLFARTMCPPTDDEEPQRPFAEYVRTLDLSNLGNRRYTDDGECMRAMEKLLLRVKGSLEVFVAAENMNP
jgi:hypothetical protein